MKSPVTKKKFCFFRKKRKKGLARAVCLGKNRTYQITNSEFEFEFEFKLTDQSSSLIYSPEKEQK